MCKANSNMVDSSQLHEPSTKRLIGAKGGATRVAFLTAMLAIVAFAPSTNAQDSSPIQTKAVCAPDATKQPIAVTGQWDCKAALAIYVDQTGKFLYMEDVTIDPRRIVPIIPTTTQACGAPANKCTVCWAPGMCGCIC
jgi:hypothetical protein